MIKQLIAFTLIALIAVACKDSRTTQPTEKIMNNRTFKSGYSDVSKLNMYYEVYPPSSQADGKGMPLVLIHGGGSTIQTSFGRVIPLFSKSRQLICVELQAHGRTGDRNTPISFKQDADDVATLLKNLQINKADILGFSNDGNTALQMAITHPELCNKIVAGSVLLKRDGLFRDSGILCSM